MASQLQAAAPAAGATRRNATRTASAAARDTRAGRARCARARRRGPPHFLAPCPLHAAARASRANPAAGGVHAAARGRAASDVRPRARRNAARCVDGGFRVLHRVDAGAAFRRRRPAAAPPLPAAPLGGHRAGLRHRGAAVCSFLPRSPRALLTRSPQVVIALVAAYAAKVLLLPERKKQARAPAASTPGQHCRATDAAARAELSGADAAPPARDAVAAARSAQRSVAAACVK